MNLTPVERKILKHLLLEGDDRAVNIAEKQDVHRVSVSRSAANLRESGLIRDKGHGTYQLTLQGMTAARNIVGDTGSGL